jgi:glycosyltransferase involved in cell wall biosynthesis
MESSRRVVFVNRYFHPDHSATSQMASDLAFHLIARGWDVHAVTSRQRYDDSRASLAGFERVDGLTLHRVKTTTFGRSSLFGRSIDYATFYLSAFFAILRLADRRTTIIAMTDPPLISVVAAAAAAIGGSPLVNWIHDLFPEIAMALGVRVPPLARALRNWSLRRGRPNVVLGARMQERLAEQHISSVMQPNWADARLAPVWRENNALRRAWGLGDSFVVGYSGNLGRAHEFQTLLGAMRELAGDERIRFLIIGAGAKLDDLKASAPDNVVFQPYQERERLSESLSAADAHIVSLPPALEGLILPSKLYGALAVARPVLFIGETGGEIARTIETGGAGFAVQAGDHLALAQCIRAMANDPAIAARMSQNARALHDTRFAPAIALANWEQILLGASHAD